MVRPTLTVDGNTNLRTIQGFIHQHHADGKEKRLLAKSLDNDTKILYFKERNDIVNKYNEKKTDKQNAARNILTQAVNNSLKSDGVPHDAVAREQLQRIADIITEGYFSEGGGRVLTSNVFDIASGVATLLERIDKIPPPPSSDGPSFDNPQVNLASLGPSFADGQEMTEAGEALSRMPASLDGARDAIEAAADALGTAIAKAYAKPSGGHTPSECAAFALSTGETLKRELSQAFAGIGADGLAEQLSTRAFEIAASKVGDNKADPAATHTILGKDGREYTVPEVTLDKKHYKPEKFLGAGGFGDVFLYRQTNAKPGQAPHEFAMKLPHNGSLDGQREALAELEMHRAVLGPEGSGYIMGDAGAVRMPDGGIALTMEALPNGDVHSFATKLTGAVAAPDDRGRLPAGKISEQDAKLVALTLTRDMARGLAHLNGAREMTHYDFKGQNCVIDKGGTAKIIDFGTAISGKVVTVNESAHIDTPYWLAPERMHASREMMKFGNMENTKLAAERKEAREILTTAFNKIGLDTESQGGKRLISQIAENIADKIWHQGSMKEDRNKTTVNNSVDIWALGVTAHELFTGTIISGETQLDAVEDHVLGWDQKNSPAIDRKTAKGQIPTNGALLSTTGHKDADALLNKILSRNPKDRPEAGTIANASVFKQKGVDSPAVRTLIVAIASGDATQIDAARQQLAADLKAST